MLTSQIWNRTYKIISSGMLIYQFRWNCCSESTQSLTSNRKQDFRMLSHVSRFNIRTKYKQMLNSVRFFFVGLNIWIMHETQAYRSGAKVTYCILQNTLTFFSYMGDFRFINFSITVFINSYLYEYVLSKYNYCNWREKSDKDENVWNDAKNKNI